MDRKLLRYAPTHSHSLPVQVPATQYQVLRNSPLPVLYGYRIVPPTGNLFILPIMVQQVAPILVPALLQVLPVQVLFHPDGQVQLPI